MSARFRIRTPTGQELSFASLDVFREFVRSGDLSPDDVVYDAETREWSSARTHPVVLEIELAAEESAGAASDEGAEATAPHEATADEPAGVEESTPTFAMGDIGLDLAPEPSQLSPEQEAEQFLAQLEAERVSDLSASEGVQIQSFTMEQSEPPPTLAPAPPISPPPAEPAPRAFRPERTVAAPARRAPAAEPKPSPVWKYASLAVLAVAVAGVGLYFGPGIFAPAASEGSDPAPEPVTAQPAPTPVIPATDDAVLGRASERYLTSTQALLRQLEPIPQAWLSGRYLAEPSDHPHVRDVWQTYLGTIREIRAGDAERYRVAYGRALDDAGVQEPARTTRLASGLTRFQASAAARNGHFDRVERLATVAISGHDALVAAEGRILYEPATGPRVSNDPVIEAVGRTPADQALLEEILDAILGELRDGGGPGTASSVREWVYEGLLDAVTN